jgi:hypothetical protein
VTLVDRILARQPGLCLYGLSPPRRSTPPAELAEIVARQRGRLGSLDLDGVIVYDIQDEAERTALPRPFPFLPTLPPDSYADEHLAGIPAVVYRSVSRDEPQEFVRWLNRGGVAVLVGAPSRQSRPALALAEAYRLARQHAPELVLGGIAIAERHSQRLDEHQRMVSKSAAGCRFFVTQAVYDVTSTKSLLSDYALAADEPAPVILTFSPCGSGKTLSFMKWLGIAIPRWLDNDLRHAADPLATSLDQCERIFLEAWDYARSKGVPLGVNVESISIRKVEIEASLELFRRLQRAMGRAPTAAAP